MPEKKSLTPEQRRVLFGQFLQCLDREENLIHYRMSWGLQWNLAGFAALFALGNTGVKGFFYYFSMTLLAAIGTGVSFISFVGIKAAHEQSQYLINRVEDDLGVKDKDWSKVEFIRPYGDPVNVHPKARRVSAAFPLIFIVFWLLVVGYSVSRSYVPVG